MVSVLGVLCVKIKTHFFIVNLKFFLNSAQLSYLRVFLLLDTSGHTLFIVKQLCYIHLHAFFHIYFPISELILVLKVPLSLMNKITQPIGLAQAQGRVIVYTHV